MKFYRNLAIIGLSVMSLSVNAMAAKSEKHAKRATELRQSVFKLTYSNMGPMGAMAKGKMPMDVAKIKKNSKRLVQLSKMMSDYFVVDMRKFDVETEALDKIWQDKDLFETKIKDLTVAAKNLHELAKKGDKAALKSAIGKVGQACGSCHDDFKKD